MATKLTVEGLDELLVKLKNEPAKMDALLTEALTTTNLILWESVPSYPPKPPGSTYIRKVSSGLGGSLGISEGGGMSGTPQIYTVKKSGRYLVSEFGTRLKYAPYVIGSREGQQAWMHKGKWWTLPETVVEKAIPKITALFQLLKEKLAAYFGR